jgi:hypothetical protein
LASGSRYGWWWPPSTPDEIGLAIYGVSPHLALEVSCSVVQLLDGVFGVADPGENPRPQLWPKPVMAMFYAFMKASFR